MPQSSVYCFSCQAGHHKYSLAFLSITVLFNRPPALSQTVKVKLKASPLCPTLCDPMVYTVHGMLQSRILEWVAFPFSRGVFPTQGSNPGLPHCRQILYQLSHQGSPSQTIFENNYKLHSFLPCLIRRRAAHRPIHIRVFNVNSPPPENISEHLSGGGLFSPHSRRDEETGHF